MIDPKKFGSLATKLGMSKASAAIFKKLSSEIYELQTKISYISKMRAISGGIYTTKGGSSTEVITDKKIKSSMTCCVTLHTEGSSPVSIKYAKCGDGKLTVEFSADPSTDHKLNYMVHL